MTDPSPTPTASCPICRAPFLATQARHRYCCERCRKTAWRRRHARSRAGHDPTGNAVPRPGDVPRDVPAVAAAPSQPVPPTRCPHCAGPITVINLLVAPAAAHVTTPGSPHGQ